MRGRLRLLDVGFGKGERLADYAKRPRSKKRFFLGIDEASSLDSTRRNLEFRSGDFVRELKKIPSNSFDIVNADLLFEGLFDNYPKGMSFEEMDRIAWQKTPVFFDEVKRILSKSGMVCITHYAVNIESARRHFMRHGFEVISARRIAQKKIF